MSGAGDSFLGGFLASQGAARGLKVGTYCAFKSLESFDTVSSAVSEGDMKMEIREWEKMGWEVEVLYDGIYVL